MPPPSLFFERSFACCCGMWRGGSAGCVGSGQRRVSGAGSLSPRRLTGFPSSPLPHPPRRGCEYSSSFFPQSSLNLPQTHVPSCIPVVHTVCALFPPSLALPSRHLNSNVFDPPFGLFRSKRACIIVLLVLPRRIPQASMARWFRLGPTKVPSGVTRGEENPSRPQ